VLHDPVSDDGREATGKDAATLKRKYLALEIPKEEG
jgi:hypothetical protein